MNFEEFLALPVKEKLLFLKHPSWPARCQCKMFGLPLGIGSILSDNEFLHTRYICAPLIEFPDGCPDEA